MVTNKNMYVSPVSTDIDVTESLFCGPCIPTGAPRLCSIKIVYTMFCETSPMTWCNKENINPNEYMWDPRFRWTRALA